ncbi:hypothetical protein GCM10023321_37490 [Pseudonocardia eucalypti]|uniref:Uncharacterized protein n=1 Tax=Pseudonocardia eucalypti TaxID=648755 RepID=A0ABP9Q8C3_9PSEU
MLGREAWIKNESSRKTLAVRWPGAEWDDYIDGAIMAIHRSEELASVPDFERKVVLAPPERGYQAARELLADHPEWVGMLHQAFENPSARRIPIGTRETVLRDLREMKHGALSIEEAVARTILRDAQNHADAMAMSGALAPFLLSADDTEFLSFLSRLRAPFYYQADANDEHGPERQARLGELTRELIYLLVQMEELRDRRSLREETSVIAWVQTEGHRLVTAWLAEMCQAIGQAHNSPVDAAIVEILRAEVATTERQRRSSIMKVWKRPQRQMVDVMEDLFLQVLGVDTPLGLSEVGVDDLPRGGGLPERLGWIRPEYTGRQWPYLYVFGRRATRRRRAMLLRTIARGRQRQ